MTADELRARYTEIRHKYWSDVDTLVADMVKHLENHTCGAEIKTIDLKMWSGPGWDRIREASKRFHEEEQLNRKNNAMHRWWTKLFRRAA